MALLRKMNGGGNLEPQVLARSGPLLGGLTGPPTGSYCKWFVRGQLLNTLSKMEPNELKKLAAPSPLLQLSVLFLRLDVEQIHPWGRTEQKINGERHRIVFLDVSGRFLVILHILPLVVFLVNSFSF